MSNVKHVKSFKPNATSRKWVMVYQFEKNNRVSFYAGLISGGEQTAIALGLQSLNWYHDNGPIGGWAIDHNWFVDHTLDRLDLLDIYNQDKDVIPTAE